jgi:uncharacterized protein YcnI
VLTFHGPNEEAQADVTRLDMLIPTAHPIAQLLVKPVQGWHISVRTVTLVKPVVTDDGRFTQAVAEVIWSAGRIPPGQFQDFTISADPLPQGVATLAFKTIQAYSNGDVVRWIDLPQPGQPPPDNPAPLITLTTTTAATTAAGTTVRTTAGTAAGTTVRTTAASAGPGPDSTARYLAAAGLVIALLALATAVLARRRGSGSGSGET